MVDPTRPLQGEVAHVRLVVVLRGGRGALVELWWSWIRSMWDRCRLFAPQQHPGSAEKETTAPRARQPSHDRPARRDGAGISAPAGYLPRLYTLVHKWHLGA